MKIRYQYNRSNFSLSVEELEKLKSLIFPHGYIGINFQDSTKRAWFITNSETNSFTAGSIEIQSLLSEIILGQPIVQRSSDEKWYSGFLYDKLKTEEGLDNLLKAGYSNNMKWYEKKTNPDTLLNNLFLMYKAYNP